MYRHHLDTLVFLLDLKCRRPISSRVVRLNTKQTLLETYISPSKHGARVRRRVRLFISDGIGRSFAFTIYIARTTAEMLCLRSSLFHVLQSLPAFPVALL